MNEFDFRELLEKYISGKLETSEKILLAEALDNPGYQLVLDKVLRESYDYSTAYPVWAPSGRAEFVDRLLKKVHGTEQRQTARQIRKADQRIKPGIRRLIFRYRWIAAAVFIILAVSAWFFYLHSVTGSEVTNVTMASLIPGGNKAVLTLGDGSRIELDSAADGKLTQEGGAAIVKLADGKIAYQAAAGTKGKILFNTMATPRGGEYQVVLPDGTRVWLNAASSIRYPNLFVGDRRQVEVAGEAYFEVAKDDNRPFVVKAAGIDIQVLGTAFNLMAYPDEDAVKTTLVSGAVKVQKGNIGQLLRPNQQASLPVGSNNFVLSEPKMREVLGWKEGHFRFEGVKITTIMRQIARWYDVEIEYRGVPPSNEFNGSLLRNTNASHILKALERTGNVHFKIEGKKVIVLAGKG